MDDTLADVVHFEFGDAKLGAIGVECFDLQARNGIGNALRTISRRHVMVGYSDSRIGTAWDASGELQPLEGLWAGDFVHQMAINIEQRGAIRFDMNHMGVPQFLVQGLTGHAE